MKCDHDACDIERCLGCPSQSTSLLTKLDGTTLQQLQEMRGARSFEKGEKIPFQFDGKDGFHIIRSGKVKVSFETAKGRSVRIEGPGGLLGYGEWLYPGHSATALEDVQTCYFSQASFENLLQSSSRLSANLVQLLCRTIWLSDGRISGLESNSVRAKVAHVLDVLNRDFGIASEHGTKIDLKADRKTLAELAGTAVESFSRVLTDLENEKIIAREGWIIHIVDAQKLALVANT